MQTPEWQSIEIDFDVYKALTIRRATPSVTYNDVLREVLGIGPATKNGGAPVQNGTPWITKGAVFPPGTEFRATYKGKDYQAHVEKGALFFNGTKYSSLSPAAIAITERPTNGWIFFGGLDA
jgi:hypothetical protein